MGTLNQKRIDKFYSKLTLSKKVEIIRSIYGEKCLSKSFTMTKEVKKEMFLNQNPHLK